MKLFICCLLVLSLLAIISAQGLSQTSAPGHPICEKEPEGDLTEYFDDDEEAPEDDSPPDTFSLWHSDPALPEEKQPASAAPKQPAQATLAPKFIDKETKPNGEDSDLDYDNIVVVNEFDLGDGSCSDEFDWGDCSCSDESAC